MHRFFTTLKWFKPVTEELWLHLQCHFQILTPAHHLFSNETIIVQDC